MQLNILNITISPLSNRAFLFVWRWWSHFLYFGTVMSMFAWILVSLILVTLSIFVALTFDAMFLSRCKDLMNSLYIKKSNAIANWPRTTGTKKDFLNCSCTLKPWAVGIADLRRGITCWVESCMTRWSWNYYKASFPLSPSIEGPSCSNVVQSKWIKKYRLLRKDLCSSILMFIQIFKIEQNFEMQTVQSLSYIVDSIHTVLQQLLKYAKEESSSCPLWKHK